MCFGDVDMVRVDVCIVVVINGDFKWMVDEGCFCEDLYYWFNVIMIELLLLWEC